MKVATPILLTAVAAISVFAQTTTPFCVTFGNHDSERKGEGFLTRQEQYDWFKALTLCSYNDNDPGLRLFVVHPDGSFETVIGSEKHPFPMPEDGSAYRPAPASAL